MHLVTIQNKKVLNILKSGKIYKADFAYICDDIEKDYSYKISTYQVLMKHYMYITPPIFCAVLNRFAIFDGTKYNKDSIILKIDVPDDLIKMHLNITWKIILRSFEEDTWTSAIYNGIEAYLDGRNADLKDMCVQAVIPYIKPEWLIEAYKVPKNFMDLFSSKSPVKEVLKNEHFNKDILFSK